MPIYEYKCEDDHLSEQYFSIANRQATVPCECGKTAKRIFSPPFISVEYIERQDYSQSLNVQEGFRNKSELKEHMRKNNLREGTPEDRAKASQQMKEARECKMDTGAYNRA